MHTNFSPYNASVNNLSPVQPTELEAAVRAGDPIRAGDLSRRAVRPRFAAARPPCAARARETAAVDPIARTGI